LNRLQKRLEETEAAMERILRDMNQMSGKLVAKGILPSATFYKNDQITNITNKLKVYIEEVLFTFFYSIESIAHFDSRYGAV